MIRTGMSKINARAKIEYSRAKTSLAFYNLKRGKILGSKLLTSNLAHNYNYNPFSAKGCCWISLFASIYIQEVVDLILVFLTNWPQCVWKCIVLNSILGHEDTMRFQEILTEYKADLWREKEMQMSAVSRQMNEAQGHIAQIPVGVVELEVKWYSFPEPRIFRSALRSLKSWKQV